VLPKSEVLQHLKMFGSRANKLYYKKKHKITKFPKIWRKSQTHFL